MKKSGPWCCGAILACCLKQPWLRAPLPCTALGCWLQPVSGLRNGTVNTLASGIMEGRFVSREMKTWVRSYRAIFTLENRLELDTGGITSNTPTLGLGSWSTFHSSFG
jgi:hypothetical protein